MSSVEVPVPQNPTKELHKPKAMENLAYLPEHIVILIMSKLPVKSLLKFRAVSKHWLALITSSEVIESSLSHQTATNPRIIFGSTSSIFTRTVPRRRGNTWTLTPESTIRYFDLSYILHRLNLKLARPSSGKISIVGSCNGLICFNVTESSTRFVLSNPLTRELRIIPEPIISPLEGSRRKESVTVGFGFDPIAKVYKLVRFVGFCHFFPSPETIKEVQVLDNNSWRKLDLDNLISNHNPNDLASRVHLNEVAINVNGALHWWAQDTLQGYHGVYCILSFDLHNETFRKIASPPRNRWGNDAKLWKWRDSLVALVDYEFWVLNHNNNNNDSNNYKSMCWTMLFKIKIPYGDRKLGLLGLWKDQVVIRTKGKYDKVILCQHPQLSGEGFDKVKEIILRGSKMDESFHFVESLVSVY